MNKLITSLACGTVLSMSLMGASYASNAVGSAALGGIPAANTGMDGTAEHTRMMNTEGNLMNGTTGTMNQHESIMKDKIRIDDNYRPNNYNTNNYNDIGTTTEPTALSTRQPIPHRPANTVQLVQQRMLQLTKDLTGAGSVCLDFWVLPE